MFGGYGVLVTIAASCDLVADVVICNTNDNR
jgi:hypothetical protein